MEIPFWIQAISIVVVIISPLLAVWLTAYRADRVERRREKMEILKILMMTRANRSSMPYVNALNTIDIVFYDCNAVREISKALIDEYWKKEPDYKVIENKNLRLIEEISKELGYGRHINWEQISVPYIPKWLTDEQISQEKFKQGQLQFVELLTGTNSASNEKQSSD